MSTRREFMTKGLAATASMLLGRIAAAVPPATPAPAAAQAAEKVIATGTLHSINVAPGGVPKKRVEMAEITAAGVQGDKQNSEWHRKPTRAVTLLALATIKKMQQEGHPIAVGTTGENLTVDGIANEVLKPGVKVRVGAAVVLEVALYLPPCGTIKQSFKDGDVNRISQDKHPGDARVGARVLVPGQVKIGDPVVVLGKA